MYSYGKSSYNRRYENENKYESSLSNVYRELMNSNKENPIIYQYDTRKSSDYNNNHQNYHFLNRNNSNRSQYKSVSPPVYNNNFSSNVSKNFFSNYEGNRNNNDYLSQKGYNRNLSYEQNRNNLNRSSSNIFSNGTKNNNNYNNETNNIYTINRKNFYDTITNFGPDNYNNYNNKINNRLYNNNERDTFRNSNYSSSNNKPDLIYKNYFNENKNNNINRDNNYSNGYKSNQSHYNKSPENYNLRSYDSKRNLFLNKNADLNYSPIKSTNFENRLYKGFSVDNIHNKNNYKTKYNITNYSSSTMAGTNGYGITKTNQDSYIIKVDKNNFNENEYTFGVFDGHGAEGHLVSQAIKQFFMNCSFFDFSTKSMIMPVFASLSRIINNAKYFDSIGSGSTVVIVHVTPEKLISINCGDSRAILITKDRKIIQLTRDHKPELPEEKQRIEASGGRVDKIYGMGPYRVWFKNEDYPGLAMSRSIGDKLAHKVGVSDIPEIKEFDLNNMEPLALVVASDGVWEFMSHEEVRSIVMNYGYSKDANSCAKNIVEKARYIWQGTGYAIDDITCVIAFFGD